MAIATAADVLEVARRELGKHETPPGSNLVAEPHSDGSMTTIEGNEVDGQVGPETWKAAFQAPLG